MKLSRVLLPALLLAVLCSCSKTPDVKYVFYFIGDGMGINQVFGTEKFNQATGRQDVNFAHFPVRGFVTTHSSSSLVTDSAAGGTALASGVKTYNSAIGVDPDTLAVTCLTDWASANGFGTGVCTSVGLNHATPACFIAHTSTRKNYEDISTQYLSSPVDFAAGAGFIREGKSEKDNAYFIQASEQAGIKVFRGPSFDGIANATGRVLCLSGKDQEDLPYAIDRQEGDTKLADFVKAGIDYLEANFGKKGFFFMIEGGKIDWASHADDAAAMVHELNDMAEAMDVVLAFYERHPEQTLIVVTADHETGGLMLGSGKYEMTPELLLHQTASKDVLKKKFNDAFFPEGAKRTAPNWAEVKEFLSENLGLWSSVPVSARTEAALHNLSDQSKSNGDALVVEAIDVLTRAAGYQWSYGAHSGSPVGLYVKGKCAESFARIEDNTGIAPMIASLAGYRH